MCRCVIGSVIPGVSKVPVDHSAPEDEGSTFLRNVVNELLSDTASLPKDWDSRESVFVGKKKCLYRRKRGSFSETRGNERFSVASGLCL
jgi:hypothetical protein